MAGAGAVGRRATHIFVGGAYKPWSAAALRDLPARRAQAGDRPAQPDSMQGRRSTANPPHCRRQFRARRAPVRLRTIVHRAKVQRRRQRAGQRRRIARRHQPVGKSRSTHAVLAVREATTGRPQAIASYSLMG